jgi:hypothetical protein
VLGPPPGDAQALQGQADGLAREHARGPAPAVADGGQAVEGPQAGGLAAEPGAVVQQVLQGRGVGLGQRGPGGVGPRGLLPQAGQAVGLEGAEGVAHGPLGAAQVAGDVPKGLALVAGEQDLAAAQGEGVGGAKAGAQGGTLRGGEGTDKEWWMHIPFFGLQHSWSRPRLPLH